MMIGGDASLAKRKPFTWLARTIIITNFGLAGLLVVTHLWFGSVPAALARLRADSLVADRYEKSFGTAMLSEERKVSFRLTNSTDHPIAIIGGTSSCGCTVASGLPTTIGARAAATLEVRVMPEKVGKFEQTVLYYTDDHDQRAIRLRITGRVVEDLGSPHSIEGGASSTAQTSEL